MHGSLPARLSAAVTRAGNAVGDELFPLLVWLTVFGVTRLAPSLILRFSIAVPQTMDVPQLLRWRRTTSAGGLTADELSAQLADLINSAPSGSSGAGHASRIGALLPDASGWTRTWHHLSEYLFSILTYPQRLLTYALFQRSQQPALQTSDTAQRHRSVVTKMLLRLVTSFTATWVHASGGMLYDTFVTYLSTRMGSWSTGGTAGFVLGSGGPGQNASSTQLNSGWRDLLVAACVSTSVNFCLQTFLLAALTNVGEPRTPNRGRRTAASDDDDDDPTSSFTHVVLSTLSRLGSKDSLYRLGRMVTRPRSSSPSLGRSDTAYVSSPAAVPSATSTAAAPARHPFAPPARVFLCGGNAFVFALSGFRFTFYADIQQLTTSAANCVTDTLDLLLRQANERAAAQRYRSVANTNVWQPPVSLQAAGLATSNDVVLSPASSLQLLPIYLVNFVVGAGVGLVWREHRLLIAAGRKVPLVRSVLGVLLPPPPPPLKLPDALQELSPEFHILVIHTSGLTEVVGEDYATPIVKHEEATTTATAAPPAASRPDLSSTREGDTEADRHNTTVRQRIVVAADLFCPIKRTLMCDPVQTVDGFTYDRDGIEEWLRVHHTAPLTNLHLDSVAVHVNWAARRQIEELVVQYTAAIATP